MFAEEMPTLCRIMFNCKLLYFRTCQKQTTVRALCHYSIMTPIKAMFLRIFIVRDIGATASEVNDLMVFVVCSETILCSFAMGVFVVILHQIFHSITILTTSNSLASLQYQKGLLKTNGKKNVCLEDVLNKYSNMVTWEDFYFLPYVEHLFSTWSFPMGIDFKKHFHFHIDVGFFTVWLYRNPL